MGGAQGGDVEALSRVGLQAMSFDDEVGLAKQRRDVRIRRRPDDRLLAGVEEGEERRVPALFEVRTGADQRRSESPVGRLDLDDLGAAVDEQLRAVRAGDLIGEIEHADSGLRPCLHLRTFV